MRLFIDSGPLRALASPRDQWRKQTIATLNNILSQKPHFITTDYIIDEVYTGLLNKNSHSDRKIAAFNRVLRNNFATIEWIGQKRFLQAELLLLKTSKDKQWSFTDCTSYVVMKELELTTVFSFDTHFEQMGFNLLSEKNV